MRKSYQETLYAETVKDNMKNIKNLKYFKKLLATLSISNEMKCEVFTGLFSSLSLFLPNPLHSEAYSSSIFFKARVNSL